jgi:hypothetical protein
MYLSNQVLNKMHVMIIIIGMTQLPPLKLSRNLLTSLEGHTEVRLEFEVMFCCLLFFCDDYSRLPSFAMLRECARQGERRRGRSTSEGSRPIIQIAKETQYKSCQIRSRALLRVMLVGN